LVHLYRLLLLCITIGLPIAALFSKKIKAFVVGRKDVWTQLAAIQKQNYLWIHTASLGEFEQIRPLIEKIKKEAPNTPVLLTFFSPSGYQQQKNYPLADVVCYLPLDSPQNARRFLQYTQPRAALLVKNEFWPNYLQALQQQNIPTYSVSSRFFDSQFYFKNYGKWLLSLLRGLDHFYVQDKASESLLRKHGIAQVSLSGDTRFDRVSKVATEKNPFPELQKSLKNDSLFVAGSVWEDDMQLLSQGLEQLPTGWKVLLAPHLIDQKNLKKIADYCSGQVGYWSYQKQFTQALKIIIVDTIGDLNRLYAYATLAYVGGGMHKGGLHNVLEPAAQGIPIVIGKYYQRFPEAQALQKLGGLQSISRPEEFSQILKTADLKALAKKGNANLNFTQSQKGATEIIFKGIQNHLG